MAGFEPISDNNEVAISRSMEYFFKAPAKVNPPISNMIVDESITLMTYLLFQSEHLSELGERMITLWHQRLQGGYPSHQNCAIHGE